MGYIGICNQLGIEIQFTSIDQDTSTVHGKRIPYFSSMRYLDGTGAVRLDVVWDNKREYIGCVAFEYSDVDENGMRITLRFNTLHHSYDCDFMYFEGEYLVNYEVIGHFALVCVGMQQRCITAKPKTLQQFHMRSDFSDRCSVYLNCVDRSAHQINRLFSQR